MICFPDHVHLLVRARGDERGVVGAKATDARTSWLYTGCIFYSQAYLWWSCVTKTLFLWACKSSWDEPADMIVTRLSIFDHMKSYLQCLLVSHHCPPCLNKIKSTLVTVRHATKTSFQRGATPLTVTVQQCVTSLWLCYMCLYYVFI